MRNLFSKNISKKVIVRVKGGLGNQLFCYAAGRRLALINEAELVIDSISGFQYDLEYKRRYELMNFNIAGRIASKKERLDRFGRINRKVVRLINSKLNYSKRWYVEQEGFNFDARLLGLQVKNTLILDGYWQSEGYFKDIANIIRDDFKIKKSYDNAEKYKEILLNHKEYVVIHYRWFDKPGANNFMNLKLQYYKNAITYFEAKLDKPIFILFSDNNPASIEIFKNLSDRIIFLSDENKDAIADLKLMSQFKYYVLSNSTFNWWAAWLAPDAKCIVIPSRDTFPILPGQYNCLYDAFRKYSFVIDSNK
jgi:hypothetical protein